MTLHSIRFPDKILKKIPSLMMLPVNLVPFPLQGFCLERVLGNIFKEQIEDGDVDFLHNNVLLIHMQDIGLKWFISFDGVGFKLLNEVEDPAVIIQGKVNEFILLSSRRVDPDTLFFQRRLEITGDTELGLQVKNLLDSVDEDKIPMPMEMFLQCAADYVEKLCY